MLTPQELVVMSPGEDKTVLHSVVASWKEQKHLGKVLVKCHVSSPWQAQQIEESASYFGLKKGRIAQSVVVSVLSLPPPLPRCAWWILFLSLLSIPLG